MIPPRYHLAIVLLATGGGVCRAAEAQIPAGADSIMVRAARGRLLFEGKGLCFSCHGKNGEGVLGPNTRLAGRRLVHATSTVAGVAALIKAGVDSAHSTSGQPMPPRGGSRLSDADVDAVAQYVLELQSRKKPD